MKNAISKLAIITHATRVPDRASSASRQNEATSARVMRMEGR